MDNNIKNIEEQLKEIKVVKENLNISEAELKSQLKSLKAAMVESEKCRPVYYPAVKGWTIVSGKFKGYKLTGTVLENQAGSKKLLKGHMDGKFAHIDMSKFTGRLADDSGKIQRSYIDGQRNDVPV
jgi:hypothetical protein